MNRVIAAEGMRMRARWLLALSTVAALVFGSATAAAATDPVQLGSGHVADVADVLDDAAQQQAEQRLQRLSEDGGAELWVVFVDEFSNPSDRVDWADTVATDNGLGQDQYLLAVATQSRQFYISGAEGGPVSFERLDQIEQQIRPLLGKDDWLGAVQKAADELGGGGGASPALTIVLIVVIAAVAVFFVLWFLRRRKRGGAAAPRAGKADPFAGTDTAELRKKASAALVAMDDAVRTSEQDLGFAVAQFGADATTEFAQALQEAKQRLQQAFELQRKIDDGQDDGDAETREVNIGIIRLCEEADAGLDEKAAAFDELRKLAQNAPESLAATQQQRTAVAGSVQRATTTLTELRGRYAAEALAPVADNPEQAAARLAFADERLDEAQRRIGAGDGGEAAVAIRDAERAIAQAEQLEKGVHELAAALSDGERRATELIADLEGDVQAAMALPDADGRVAAAIATTQERLAQARENLAGPARRPLLTLQSLTSANEQIDAVIAQSRDAAQRAQRAEQVLGQTLREAQSQVSAAEQYLSARRGAVGADARTRLAQAGAALQGALALQASDPVQSLAQAQQAIAAAQQAMQLSQSDVGLFRQQGQGSGGGDFTGALLGGIIGGMLSGGGRSRSSFGGGLGGILGSGGGYRGGRSGFGSGRPGGFRGGRSGGGGFSGGRGGRRGGGRF